MPARSLWSGTISFGLVNIPVTVSTAINTEKSLDFDLIDKRDKAHVGYQKYNKKTGKIVDKRYVTKALKLGPEKYVIFEADELKNLRLKGSSSIEIQQFIERDELSPLYFERPYFLLPGKNGEKTYVLLHEALANTKTFAVGLIVMQGKQHLSAIGIEGDALVLHLLRYSSSLRKASDFDIPKASGVKLAAREREMAIRLVEELEAPWKPEDYKNTYFQDVMSAVKNKTRSKIVEAPKVDEDEVPVGDLLDLMPLLEKSLKRKARSSAAMRARSKKSSTTKRTHSRM